MSFFATFAVSDGSELFAHMAKGNFHDDCAPKSGQVLHRHSFHAQGKVRIYSIRVEQRSVARVTCETYFLYVLQI